MGLIMLLVSGSAIFALFEKEMFLKEEIINGLINNALCSVNDHLT